VLTANVGRLANGPLPIDESLSIAAPDRRRFGRCACEKRSIDRDLKTNRKHQGRFIANVTLFSVSGQLLPYDSNRFRAGSWAGIYRGQPPGEMLAQVVPTRRLSMTIDDVKFNINSSR
jgi:hypothetical protein